MSAEQVDVEEGSEDFTTEAKELGWVPKEEFKDNQAKWVDAKTFVERGRTIIPILRNNNKTLLQNQNSLRAELSTLRKELEAARSDLSVMQEVHNEQLVERVADVRKALLDQLKEAKREQDTDREVDLTDKLTQLTTSARELEGDKKGAKKEEQEELEQPQQLNPALQAWAAANVDWWGIDETKSLKAIGLAHIVRAERPDLVGSKGFYDEVDKRMKGEQEDNPRQPGKVTGSKGGSSGRSGNGRTYADLPAEAKQQCDKYAKKFVNPDGRFKTAGDYQKHFIQTLEQTGYFADN